MGFVPLNQHELLTTSYLGVLPSARTLLHHPFHRFFFVSLLSSSFSGFPLDTKKRHVNPGLLTLRQPLSGTQLPSDPQQVGHERLRLHGRAKEGRLENRPNKVPFNGLGTRHQRQAQKCPGEAPTGAGRSKEERGKDQRGAHVEVGG